MPSSATASIKVPMKSWRARGSRRAAGSSRTSISGWRARATARATWARWPPDRRPTFALLGMSRAARRRWASVSSQRSVRLAASLNVSATVKFGYSGVSWATNPIRARRRVGSRGQAVQDGDPAGGRCGQADGEVQQGGLARTVGSDQRHGPVAWNSQGAVVQRPGVPVALAEHLGLDDVHDAASDELPRRASCRAMEIKARMESSSSPAS